MTRSSVKLGVARKFAPDLVEYITFLGRAGVDALEIGFAFGIPPKLDNEAIAAAKKCEVALSCHLPFWINLGNDNTQKNIEYLTAGLRVANQLGSIAVFHLGFYGGKSFDRLLPSIVSTLREVVDRMGPGIGRLGIETTGKQKALGTVEEIAAIVTNLDGERFIPVVDWAHIYARTDGECPTSVRDVDTILDRCNEVCTGISYFHGGGIEYKNGNEIRHVSVISGSPSVEMIIATLLERCPDGLTYIVESPDSIEDVKWLRMRLGLQSQ